MESKEYITIETICRHHSVSDAFVLSLGDYDLIEIQKVNEVHCVPQRQLSLLEKFVRLHHDLQINPEGITAIHHLTGRIESLQEEISFLRQRLEVYESEEK
jgi:hypothetical protein